MFRLLLGLFVLALNPDLIGSKPLAAAKVSSTAYSCLGPGTLPTPFRFAGFACAVGLRLVGSALGPYEWPEMPMRGAKPGKVWERRAGGNLLVQNMIIFIHWVYLLPRLGSCGHLCLDICVCAFVFESAWIISNHIMFQSVTMISWVPISGSVRTSLQIRVKFVSLLLVSDCAYVPISPIQSASSQRPHLICQSWLPCAYLVHCSLPFTIYSFCSCWLLFSSFSGIVVYGYHGISMYCDVEHLA